MPKNLQDWRKGYGVIRHTPQTQQKITALLEQYPQAEPLFKAADKLANAAMWLAVHQVYARNIFLDGRPLETDDFKPDPQGHLGGSLNMVPAYVGYLLANAITGFTRGWLMEQGHAVSGVDSANLLVGNVTDVHAGRYNVSDEGLSRFSRDFYSYALTKDGLPESPLGSHVNAHTAGGVMEGGYLGFAGLQYVHVPLPGERLVAFLSDGAWEEQKGTDWAPRWWRAKDSGLVVPVMIANGRRIDQRTTMAQQGGARWFARYLKLHNFDPVIIDGRDPLAFAWAIIEAEKALQKNAEKASSMVRMPYIIAVAPKGAGFYNAGKNPAHNLPLVENPSKNAKAQKLFNWHVHKLFVPQDELTVAANALRNHKETGRVLERDNSIANRRIQLETVPALNLLDVASNRSNPFRDPKHSPMDAIDRMYRDTVMLNPHLRARVGNPDEMLSNRMDDTLKLADFRVTDPEDGNTESRMGAVITALNEEAVAAAAFGNKGGINLIVTYEAFGEKMHGIARQEVIFSRHQKEAGKPPGWLSVPLVLTSNTWENGKNELSHQDPSMVESMLAESADISRAFFPAEYNSAAYLMREAYQTQGQLWTMVMAKVPAPVLFSEAECEQLWKQGAIRIAWAGHKQDSAKLALLACGTHQLMEVLKASLRLASHGVAHNVVYVQEPGKLRAPRNAGEREHSVSDKVLDVLLPAHITSLLLVTHTRPEGMIGLLQRIWQGRKIKALGFINDGGTLDVEGMLYVNGCSWGHIVNHSAQLLGVDANSVLTKDEADALSGKRSPDGIIRNALWWK